MTGRFDPQEHLTIIDGRAYLEVKWRLAWLRADAPASRIETDLVDSSRDHAIFKASVVVIDAEGTVKAEATGWGSEYRDHFPSFLEAAETKALGRALAAAGYGSQYAGGFDEDAGGVVMADAPVKTNGGFTAPTQPAQPKTASFDGPPPSPPDDDRYAPPPEDYDDTAPNAYDPSLPVRKVPTGGPPMSAGAQKFFWMLVDRGSVPDGEIVAEVQKRFGFTPDGIGPALSECLTVKEGAILTNEWLKPRVGFEEDGDRQQGGGRGGSYTRSDRDQRAAL